MMSSSLMPCSAGEAAEQEEASNSNNKMPLPPLSSPPSMLLFPHHLLHHISSATPLLPSDQLHDGREMSSSMPESWSQLLLGGLVGDHERYNAATALLSKGLEEEGHVPAAYHNVYGHGGGEEIQTSSGTNRSQVSQMFLASSPRSCITTSLGSNMLDFSNNTVPAPADQLKNHHSDNSSEGNSTASGSAPKKARVQTSSSAQSTLKETIGYIRFLLNQIEALSFPYLNNGNDSDSMQQQHNLLINNHSTASNNGIGMLQVHAQGSRTTTTDEQDGGGGDEAAGNNKDLRSRGLCLVPVSYCTSHLAADDNAAASDFWAVAPAPPRPPQQQLGLGGIIWG